MNPSLQDEARPSVLVADQRVPAALRLHVRTRYLRFIYLEYRVTALSVELATDMFRQFQAAFTIEGHAEDSAGAMQPRTRAFDTHVNALRFARADAKRFIRARVADNLREELRKASRSSQPTAPY